MASTHKTNNKFTFYCFLTNPNLTYTYTSFSIFCFIISWPLPPPILLDVADCVAGADGPVPGDGAGDGQVHKEDGGEREEED